MLGTGSAKFRKLRQQRLRLGVGSREQRRLRCAFHGVGLRACPGRDTPGAQEERLQRRPEFGIVPVSLQPERDFGPKALNFRLFGLVTLPHRSSDPINGIDPFRTTDARGRGHGVGQSPPHPPRKRATGMKQKLENSVRFDRFPNQRDRELQDLCGRPKAREPSESAPWQSPALKCVVEHNAVALGDQECFAASSEFQEKFGNCVRRKVFRCGLHDKDRPVTRKGFASFDPIVVAINHREQFCLHAGQVRTERAGRHELDTRSRHPGQRAYDALPGV